ncbi:hypothetical protein BS47DRAFT_1374151 [Hydnum rufescens UP504]|uniref:Cell division cycle protein 123 n=1 Tax=Hydnum rufescens UP504 TaxID=1448309 RepID=A0A9P6AI20_9AGAM|nr:hypothetical protein BS47DRAFT_1374151 [Hydnum rufescens UP504]
MDQDATSQKLQETILPVFPQLTPADVLACQCSSWYPTFDKITIKSKIIKPLPAEFLEYLEADTVSIPEGSEDAVPVTELSDEDSDSEKGDEDDDDPHSSSLRKYAFPALDAQIREAISTFGAVFPKLNWTSPQDASWILAPSSPLKCTSPADVYLFLKSSDFVVHDLSPDMVFEGCSLEDDRPHDAKPIGKPKYQVELVLKKWFAIDKSRELRCFVRDDTLIGACITQRDPNYYEFLNEPKTHESIPKAVLDFWEHKIRNTWLGGQSYAFDILLTRDLQRANLIDFNPYAPRTDPLLFTSTPPIPRCAPPEFRVITSRTHPRATRNAPQHSHNMVPREALELSAGQNILDFQGAWAEELARAMADDETTRAA